MTDLDWNRFLAERQLDEVGSWRPSRTRFVALDHWEPFLLKLKSPVNRIVDGSFSVSDTSLPLSLVREVFVMHGQKLRVLPDRQEDQPAES